MHDAINLLQPAVRFVTRRSVFPFLGAGIGYAFGYRHMRRQRAVEAIRRARLDSIEAQLPH